MAVPFASAYAPINTLNDAIMAQAQQAQAARLAQQQMDNQGVNETMNRIVQQRALQQQAQAQQAHYGLQQQQLANDLAYRNAVLGQNTTQQAEMARQFNAKFALDKAIADANIAQMNKPGYGMGKDFGLGALQAGQDINKYNAESDPVAGAANLAIQAAKDKRDATLKDIGEGQSTWNPFRADFWRDVYYSNADWAQKAKDAQALYLKEVSQAAQATGGKATIRNKVHPQTGALIADEFEAVPVKLPQIQMPGLPAPQAEKTAPPIEPQLNPSADTVATSPDRSGGNPFSGYVAPLAQPGAGNFVPQVGGAPTYNPFMTSPFMQQIMTGQGQITVPTPAAPMVPNRALRFNPATGLLVPLQ
jgi:hypothetical protein